MTTEEFERAPAITDFHGNKRELLRSGLQRGFLNWSEIKQVLPEDMMSATELEVFVFTCENMGIELRDY